VPSGRSVLFFPPDSRSSEEKRALIETLGPSRLAEMEQEGFQDFGFDYWDRPDAKAGYGGYRYDGRYRPVAERMVEVYGLEPGERVLEVGCGKRFLLVEFLHLGLDVIGIDLSEYAVANAHPELAGRILCASVLDAPVPDDAFDLVLAKDSLPHLSESDVELAVAACERFSRRSAFLEIEVARTDHEAEMLYRWDTTHRTRRPPEWWLELFDRVGYTGDWHFKVLVEDPTLGPID